MKILQMFFKKRSAKKKNTRQTDDKFSEKNKEAFKVGISIAKLITYYWNSQEKPGKVYLFDRRVHHGGVGSLLGLSNLFKKSQPIPSGILSGLGAGLVKDDYADREEWFKFEKKKANNNDRLVPETTKTNLTYTDYKSTNTKLQQDDKKES